MTHVLFWLVAVRIGKETGLRLSDIAQLEWRCVERPDEIAVWADKTNKRTSHKISKELHNLICEIPVVEEKYVFPEQAAIIQDVKKRAGLSVQFGRLCDRLGIKGKSFHSLRHYKATNSYAKLDKEALARKLASVLSITEIKQLLGHANSKTTEGYLH